MNPMTYGRMAFKDNVKDEDVRRLVGQMLEGTDEVTESDEALADAYIRDGQNRDGATRDELIARILSWRKWCNFHRIDCTEEVRSFMLEMMLCGDVVVMHEIPAVVRERALRAGMKEEDLA